MCSPFEAAIHQYVNGQLGGEELRRLQLHFQVCGVCRHGANVLRWRSMESGSDEIAPVVGAIQPEPEPLKIQAQPPSVRQQPPVQQHPKRPPMSMMRALLVGAAAGLAISLLLAPFVPSLFSVERTHSNIEFRHLNGRMEETAKGKANSRRKTKPAPQKTSNPADPITMKLLTDDPDIVIHWTVE
jgi:hypothetical protein